MIFGGPPGRVTRPKGTVSQPFFRPSGACYLFRFLPTLAPWVALHPSTPKAGVLGTPHLRRFATMSCVCPS